MTIQLYDETTIDALPWPQTEQAQKAKRFLTPLMKNGTRHYFKNIQTKMIALHVGDYVLPVTINEKEYANSFVCSPFAHYLLYAFEEIKDNRRISRHLLKALLHSWGGLLRFCKINRVVVVNNWLYATNLYPSLTKKQIDEILHTLKSQYPKHAILFRSLNQKQYPELYQSLVHSSCKMIPGRMVYLTDMNQTDAFSSRMVKSDEKLFRKTEYEVVDSSEISLDFAPRIQELYKTLNIDKYSTLNPQFTTAFIELALKENLLHFKALKLKEQIDGVMGYYSDDQQMTSPFFGYDTSLPQEKGLYRLISHLLLSEAKEKKTFLNQSGGAGSFKKLRRAEPHLEYTAIYDRHLSITRRLPWKIMERMMNLIGLKYIRTRG